MPLIPQEQFAFCGPTYLAESPVIDAQRSINLYPTPGIASSKTRMGLVGRPGFAPFSSVGAGGNGHSLWAGEGRLFVAISGHVYEIDNGGGTVTDYGPGLNTLGPSPAPMVSNGPQLLICDPVLGNLFNVNPVGPALSPVFSDLGARFYAKALDYLDGFFVALATGASLATSNQSQLNTSKASDGTVWPALSFVALNTSADLAVQLAVLNGLIYIFRRKTTEIWYDAGNAVFNFARVNGGQLNIGCLAAASVVKFSNTILWLGGDSTGSGQVYMMQGMNPVRVSNPAIEAMIASIPVQVNLPYAKAFGYQEAGHTFYQISFGNSNYQTYNGALTLVYDLTTGLWHERTYSVFGVIPCGFASVPNFGAAIPNFVVSENGKAWYQSINYPNDGDATKTIKYTRTAPHAGQQNRWFKYPRFELDCDVGTAQPMLTYSNDGGRNFKPGGYPLQQVAAQGNPTDAPELPRFYATQLGRSRDRVFKVTITDGTNLIRIANAYLSAEAIS
jgi:hypothetical protein